MDEELLSAVLTDEWSSVCRVCVQHAWHTLVIMEWTEKQVTELAK